MDDKLGKYITKLMTTVVDKEQDEFVKGLAISELNNLKENIDSFVKKHIGKKESEELKQQLLQEEKENGK